MHTRHHTRTPILIEPRNKTLSTNSTTMKSLFKWLWDCKQTAIKIYSWLLSFKSFANCVVGILLELGAGWILKSCVKNNLLQKDILSNRTDPKLRIRIDEVIAAIKAMRFLWAADFRSAESLFISFCAAVEVSNDKIIVTVEFIRLNEKSSLAVVFSIESSSCDIVEARDVNVSTVALINNSLLEQSSSSEPSPQLLLPSQTWFGT